MAAGPAHSVVSAPWTEAAAGEERRAARVGRPLRGCGGARVAPSAAATRLCRGAERGGEGRSGEEKGGAGRGL